jgi:hypothetical protein
VKRKALTPLFIFLACSSGASIAKPEIKLVQMHVPADLGYARGPDAMTALFGFRVTNQASEPITLKRVELQSVGEGGYTLRREEKMFSHQLGPGQSVDDTIQAVAYYRTQYEGRASTEPVTLRATFHFDSPAGTFRHTVLRNFGQLPAN